LRNARSRASILVGAGQTTETDDVGGKDRGELSLFGALSRSIGSDGQADGENRLQRVSFPT